MEPAPPSPGSDAQSDRAAKQADEHIRLLAIFHYVLAGIVLVVSFCPSLHLAIGILALVDPEVLSEGQGAGPPPMLFGLLFTAIPAAMMLCGWILAALLFCAAQSLRRRVHRTFCLVVAGIECLFMPLGTVLGVFTIILLTKDEVQARLRT